MSEREPVTRHLRNRALSDLARVIEEVWGPRCTMTEAGCATCLAWAAFDMMQSITDSEYLDAIPTPPKDGEG